MLTYEQFCHFILIIGSVIATLVGISIGLIVAPQALLLIVGGTAVGLFIGANIALAILRADLAKRSLQKTNLFRI